MKITAKHILVLLGLCAILPVCEAQNTVVRRSSTTANRTDKNGLTVRAQTLYQNGEPSEADEIDESDSFNQLKDSDEEAEPA